MQRRYFLRTTALSLFVFPISKNRIISSILSTEQPGDDYSKNFPLAEVTIDTLQQKMQSGAWTAGGRVTLAR